MTSPKKKKKEVRMKDLVGIALRNSDFVPLSSLFACLSNVTLHTDS